MDAEDPERHPWLIPGKKTDSFLLKGWKLVHRSDPRGKDFSLFPQMKPFWNRNWDWPPPCHPRSFTVPREKFNLEIDSKGIDSIDLRTISIKSCVWIKLFREVASLIFLIPFKIDIKGRDVRIWGKFTVVTIAPLFLRTWNERSLEREREISGKIAAKFCPSTLRTSRQGKHSQGNPDCERESSARSGRARF